ncbi:MAG TPA: hypothetical protein VHT92_07005 [Candidatus Cybelea sp.]|jgi:hypothetical protein|nr:hypothetical protein [Candidatus Cybelea sp.]
MSESYRTTPPDQPWSGASNTGNGYQGSFGERPAPDAGDTGEAGKVLLVGVLGGLLSAAGYLIYRRLPEEQKQRINSQVRSAVTQRINEIRQNLNL